MRINMTEWSNEIIKAKDRRNLPVLFFPVIKNMEISVPESTQEADKQAEVMLEVINEYPETIAAITGMDLTVDSECFGATVKFSKRQAPNIKSIVIQDESEIKDLVIPGVDSGRQQMVLDAVKMCQNKLTDRPTFGGMLGPFSLAANLMEVSKALVLTGRNPDAMEMLLEKCTDFLINRARAFKEAGANGIFIAEPTAGLLSPDALERFSSKYVKRLVEEVQDDYFFLILHNCGRVIDSIDSMYNTGCKGFHFGNNVQMPEVLAKIPANVLVFGNIDPSSDFVMGTKEEIYEKTTKLLQDTSEFPHFVLSSGCDLAPMVEDEKIEAYYQACRDFNKSL